MEKTQKQYITISEDGTTNNVTRLSKEVLIMFEDGYYEIFDVTDLNNILEKTFNGWRTI